ALRRQFAPGTTRVPRFPCLCREIQLQDVGEPSKGPPPCKQPCGVYPNGGSYPLFLMARTRTVFTRDKGLQTRMLLTMFLLGALYVVFAGILLAAGAGIGIMVLFLAGLSLAQLFLSDKLALRAAGAHIVSPAEAPGLHAMIERLCIQADLPKPKIAIAESDVPNAIFGFGKIGRAHV